MYTIYIDDSGDIGFYREPKNEGSPNKAFVLSAVIIKDHEWLNTLDAIKEFRKEMFDDFGYLQGDELKASYLLHNKGPLIGLDIDEEDRMGIYKSALQLQVDIGSVRTFAVAVDKTEWDEEYPKKRILFWAWRLMIQRIERYSTKNATLCSVYPDRGEEVVVTGTFRRYRRFAPVQSAYDPETMLSREAELIIEDPSFRNSKESYFVQLADLNAYAAHRYLFPVDYFGQEYWEILDSILVKEVNKLTGGPPGIVVWPT